MAAGDELLAKMRRSPHDHSAGDYDRMLTHFGFKKSEQAKHTKYRHELLPPGAVVTVPRHRRIRGYVARQAIAAIDSVAAELRRRAKDKGDQ